MCWRLRGCGDPTVERILPAEFPDVKFEHMLVDSAAMHSVEAPDAIST